MSWRLSALSPILAALCSPTSAQVTVPPGFEAITLPFGSEVAGIAVSTGGAYGNYVYVATNGAVKRVDPTSGAVSSFASGLATSTGRPSGVSFDSGAFGTGMLYVVENLGRVQSISPAGAVAPLSSGGALFSSNDLVFAPAGGSFGSMLYVSNGAGGPSTVAQVDSAGANAVFAAASNFSSSPLGVDFPPDGSAFARHLYVCEFSSERLSRVDPSGAGAVFATGLGRAIDVAFSPLPAGPFGDFAYVSDTLTNVVRRVAPDGSVSVFATGFVFGASGYDSELAFAPDGSALYVGSGFNLVAIRPCGTVEGYCTAKVTSVGCTPAIGWNGLPIKSAGAGTFDVTLSATRPDKAYIFFYSVNTARNAAPFQGGFLCMQPPVRRTGVAFTAGAAPCGGSTSKDFGAIMAAAAFIAAGDMIRGEWWGRDTPGNPSLSDALEFRVCP